MGLAAFNRMRRVEAMKPENIMKENAEASKEEREEVVEEAKPEVTVEDVSKEEETLQTPRRRTRRTTNS